MMGWMQLRLAIAIAVCACTGRDPMPAATPPVGSAVEPAGSARAPAKAATEPGLPTPGVRLPEGATPLAYDLRLELDPDRDEFTGTVAIRVRLDRPSDHVWLHADELALHAATWDDGALEVVHVPGADRMIAVKFGTQLPAREVTLRFAFTGTMQHDEEGLFRQKEEDRWYLYSQGESEFARRITPCFDEPRWKTPWRVTVVVPATEVAAGNMAIASERVLADGRREVAFAETPPIASYLLALAVGPFAVIDAGVIGAAKVPLRVLTFPSRRKSVGAVARQTGKLVKELEDYTQIPLPFPKLDIVTVPHLFGAMENPGLITFDADIVFEGDRRYAVIAAHELAHQWFGNLVTPVWWDDLWLSEAFASWLGERIAAHNEGHPPSDLHVAFTRESALAADGDAGARALHRPVAFDPDNAFDAIAYDKGEAVLSMFEQWVGETKFREGLRAYLKDHAGGNVTTADLVAAIAAASTPETGRALQAYVDHAGAPVVELALACAPTPSLTATARDHLQVPVCVRLDDDTHACVLASTATPIAMTRCPKSVVASGGGYYHVVWTTDPPRGASPPWSKLGLVDKVALGADLAAATARGDLEPAAALAQIAELAADSDPYAAHAAAQIAATIDALVDDATRERWEGWLATTFAARLAAERRTPIDARVRGELYAMISAPHLPEAVRARARAAIARALARKTAPFDGMLAAGADHATFVALAKLAHDAKIDSDIRELAMADLSTFGPAEVGNAVAELLTLLPDRSAWSAVGPYFDRGATRTAAWHAVRDRASALFAKLSPSQAGDLLDATASLCDATARTELVAVFTPRVTKILDGKPRLEHVLASVDRCLARRAKAGDLAAALH